MGSLIGSHNIFDDAYNTVLKATFETEVTLPQYIENHFELIGELGKAVKEADVALKHYDFTVNIINESIGSDGKYTALISVSISFVHEAVATSLPDAEGVAKSTFMRKFPERKVAFRLMYAQKKSADGRWEDIDN